MSIYLPSYTDVDFTDSHTLALLLEYIMKVVRNGYLIQYSILLF